MARRPAAADALLALALGVDLQIELFFVDAPRNDLLVARLAVLALAGAVAIRSRAPVLAAVVTLVVTTVLERLDPSVDEELVGTFFAALIVTYGGELVTEPVDGAGYTVRARLPLERVA